MFYPLQGMLKNVKEQYRERFHFLIKLADFENTSAFKNAKELLDDTFSHIKQSEKHIYHFDVLEAREELIIAQNKIDESDKYFKYLKQFK